MKIPLFIAPTIFNVFGRRGTMIDNSLSVGYTYSFKDESSKTVVQRRVAKCGLVYCKIDSDCKENQVCVSFGDAFSMCLDDDSEFIF